MSKIIYMIFVYGLIESFDKIKDLIASQGNDPSSEVPDCSFGWENFTVTRLNLTS